MGTEHQEIVSEVVQKTNSELILFFVLMIVVLVIFVMPLYRMMLKDRSEKTKQEGVRQDKYIEREKQIIEVIKENSMIIAGLKTTLENSGASTSLALGRIHERIDHANGKITDISRDLAQINLELDTAVGNQKEISGKINKILLIVDNIPNNSKFSSFNNESPPLGADS